MREERFRNSGTHARVAAPSANPGPRSPATPNMAMPHQAPFFARKAATKSQRIAEVAVNKTGWKRLSHQEKLMTRKYSLGSGAGRDPSNCHLNRMSASVVAPPRNQISRNSPPFRRAFSCACRRLSSLSRSLRAFRWTGRPDPRSPGAAIPARRSADEAVLPCRPPLVAL